MIYLNQKLPNPSRFAKVKSDFRFVQYLISARHKRRKQGGKTFWTNQKVCLRFRSKPIRLHKFAIARENPSNFTQIKGRK